MKAQNPPVAPRTTLDRTRARNEIATLRDQVLRDVPPNSLSIIATYELIPAMVVKAPPPALDALASHPLVSAVSSNISVHADLQQSSLLINAPTVHQSLNRTGAGVVVAVLDSGIDSDHPLLADDLVYQRCFLLAGTCPGGGQVGGSAEDGNSHGTHVSGIVTASGTAPGIAPDAQIKAFKILDNAGNGTVADILSAYDEILAEHGDVRIINLSLGDGASHADGTCESFIPAFTDAVAASNAAGIVTFAASGNSTSKTGLAYPACLQGVASVGAVYDANVGAVAWSACMDLTTAADAVTCFSQSSAGLELLAPGARVTSTVVGGTGTWGGTSMASPMAAGAAALVLEAEPGLTPEQLRTRLKQRGKIIIDPANGVATCRVDALAAVLDDSAFPCDPAPGDADSDGLADVYEGAHACLDPLTPDATADPDGDGLENAQEEFLATDPCVHDTDGDGLGDGTEDTLGTDPLAPDSDGDGITDGGDLAQGTSPLSPDTDGDGFKDKPATSHAPLNANTDEDSCPTIANPDQQNSEGAAGNGPSLAGDDLTVPQSDATGDVCDLDDDNDGLADIDEQSADACGAFNLSETLHPNAARGDNTNDDNGNGIPAPPMGTDGTDDGPSWDTDNDGVRDGYECLRGTHPRDRLSKPGPLPDDSADADADGLLNGWERRQWGTAATVIDSDGDGMGDCREAADVDGNGALNSTGDLLAYAHAIFNNGPQTQDFDFDGSGVANSTGDFLAIAQRIFNAKPCL